MPIDEETNSDAEASLDEDETLKNIFDEYTKDEAKELRADALTTSPVSFAPSSSSVKRKELRAEPPATKPEERHSLNQALKRSKTTGKGADMVENIAMLLVGESVERTSFLQVRLVGPRPKKITKKTVRPKDGDKNLRYADCSPDIQAGLRKCRAEEWQKWQKYNAGVIISGDELSTLQVEVVQVYPMQWIETDKNAHKRRSNKKIPPLLKSRMVGCGNFEDTERLRTDSSTADVEAHKLVFSFCAAKKVKVRVGDVQNAYLQGQEVDPIIL